MKTRLASVLTAGATLFAGLAATAPAANAVPYPGAALGIYSQGAVQNPSNNVVYGHAVSFSTPDGSAVPTGATVTVTYASCGQVIQSATYNLDDAADGTPGGVAFLHYFSATGAPDPMENSINSKIGPVLDWSATVTYPSYDPYVVANSYSGYRVKRPSCEEILNGDDGSTNVDTIITVRKWSTKKGSTAAKVGQRLAVTATRAPGAQVSYAWNVGSKVINRGRAMTVKKSYAGKRVTLRVTVTKAGAKPLTKALRYGTAR